MKKVQNVELNKKVSPLKSIKTGKIDKSKQVSDKKLKEAVDKAVAPKLAPKKLVSNLKKNSNDGDKNKKIKNEPKKENTNTGLTNRIENGLDYKKTLSEGKSAAELKKIEKKKAKKLTLKLKKREKKAQNKSFEKAPTVIANGQQTDKKNLEKTIKKDVNKDTNKKPMAPVTSEEKSQNLEAAHNKNVVVTSSKILQNKGKQALKKQLKNQMLKTVGSKTVNESSSEAFPLKGNPALKKQSIKNQTVEAVGNNQVDETTSTILANREQKVLKKELITGQKLDTADNKTIDAANSKVLKKKENKALKRQLIKEQKLNEKPVRDPVLEESTIFVGNLPVNTKRVQLERIFKKFGPVNFIRLRSAGGKVLHKHKQRKLAGSLNAYVVLQSKEKAEKSLSLNGIEFKGNHLRVTLATKKPENEDSGEAKRTVFIGNLKYSASEESLREIFSSCGEIEYVRCLRDGDKGCKGVAYVCFKNADAVGLALELNETMVDERAIHVERYNIKKLGAKKARDAQAEKEAKSKTGAKLRLEGKKGKKEKTNHKTETRDELGNAKKSKKSEFRGVKVEGLKKKQKPKKKKSNDQMLQLAKKIAPKPKN